jgi:hypothetical protein
VTSALRVARQSAQWISTVISDSALAAGSYSRSCLDRRDTTKWMGATVITSTIFLEQATAGTTFGSATPESVGSAAEQPSALRLSWYPVGRRICVGRAFKRRTSYKLLLPEMKVPACAAWPAGHHRSASPAAL